MEQQIIDALKAQDQKIEAIYASVEKTRKYFLWTMILTVVTFGIPLILVIIAIPFYLGTLQSVTNF